MGGNILSHVSLRAVLNFKLADSCVCVLVFVQHLCQWPCHDSPLYNSISPKDYSHTVILEKSASRIQNTPRTSAHKNLLSATVAPWPLVVMHWSFLNAIGEMCYEIWSGERGTAGSCSASQDFISKGTLSHLRNRKCFWWIMAIILHTKKENHYHESATSPAV